MRGHERYKREKQQCGESREVVRCLASSALAAEGVRHDSTDKPGEL